MGNYPWRGAEGFAGGEQNWRFSGSPRGANASMTRYTFIETVKANDIEQLPTFDPNGDCDELLPSNITLRKPGGY